MNPPGIEAPSHPDALALLRWLIDMGADEATGPVAVDRFGEAEQLRSAPTRPAPALPRSAPTPAPPVRPAAPPPSFPQLGGSAGDAVALAAACNSLAEIAAALATFDACPLKRTATNLVYIDGNPEARLLLIGEAPGREEDLTGKPFVGRSGQLLDKMLAAIGLSRSAAEASHSVLISNLIFWRPPGNRKPTEAETLMCLPFVRRTIELARPRAIVCLGATPAQRLSGTTEGILALRGKWRQHRMQDGSSIPLLPTLHPAYLLRQPAQKRLAWRDFLTLSARFDHERESPG
jgi:uracil-DNA glycosylase family 4